MTLPAGTVSLLAVDTVHFVGQPIFLVVATSHRAARVAAQLGAIEYEELPALLTIDAAMAADSKFEDAMTFQNGDADGAMAASDRQVEGSMEIGGQEHFYMEPTSQMVRAHVCIVYVCVCCRRRRSS